MKTKIVVVMISVVIVVLILDKSLSQYTSFAKSLISEKSQDSGYIHLNKVIAKLERGELVTGIWSKALHFTNAIGLVQYNNFPDYEESMTRPMIDYILIDMEHNPFDMTELQNYLLALNSKREVKIKGNLQPNIAVYIRCPAEGFGPVHREIKQVLDIGVHGVVVPHVRNAAEAEKIVKACRYVQPKGSAINEPVGMRGASPWIASYIWGLTMDEYLERADVWPLNPKGDIHVVLMIEDEEGVKNIDEIVNVPGVGAIMFGPYDFSFSIGQYGNTEHPEVVKTWDILKKACDRKNIPFIGFANPDNVADLIKKEYKTLLFGSDVRMDGSIQAVFDKINEDK